jgi:hypothetical protein
MVLGVFGGGLDGKPPENVSGRHGVEPYFGFWALWSGIWRLAGVFGFSATFSRFRITNTQTSIAVIAAPASGGTVLRLRMYWQHHPFK